MEKRADVDVILNQIIKVNNCVNINIDFLAVCLNYSFKDNVIVKKKCKNIESYSLNENAQIRDLKYYATFKVSKFELLLYKSNTLLQKTTTCIGLQVE